MKLPAFYPIVSTVATAEAVLEAGAKILQYRNKQLLFRARPSKMPAASPNFAGSAGALFVVNDRADVACC